MPSPTWLDFARLSAASYNPDTQSVAGGWVCTWFGAIGTGFQGARYRRAAFGVIQEVVAYTGTDSALDGLTDVGFAGDSTVARIARSFPSLNILVAAGTSGLASQLSYASELLQQARWYVGRTGGQLYLTGHSLGGGLAQLMAAEFGGMAAPISAPTVTQIPGVNARVARNRPSIVCLRVENDPINGTEILGQRLGTTVRMGTARSVATAHSIDGTVIDLSSAGCATSIGANSPFELVIGRLLK
jgi:hypothetical protein